MRRQPPVLMAGAAGLALVLAGCGLGGPPAAEQDGAADELTVWFPGTDTAEIELVTNEIVPAFEAETGATVEVTFSDWSDQSTKLNAAFAGGAAPDVFGHGPAAVPDFTTEERVVALDDRLAELPEADREDMAAALPGGQVDGVQYMMSMTLEAQLLVYDADAFTEAGLDPDEPPTTWQEAREIAEQLTERDGEEITRSGMLLPSATPVGVQQAFANLLYANGGSQISADGTQPEFDSPESVEALEYLTGLYAGEDAVATGLGADFSSLPPAQQPLLTGDAAMMLSNAPAVLQMLEADPELDLRVAPPLGFGPDDDPAALGGAGPGLMINADSPRQDLAWEFITYFLSPDVNAEYTDGIGAIPMRASAVDSDYVTSNPLLETYLAAAPSVRPNPLVPGWVQTRDTMSAHLEQATNERVPAEQALQDAAAEVESVLGRNG